MLYINLTFPLIAALLLFLAGGAARRGRILEAVQYTIAAGIFAAILLVANTPK